MSLRVGWLGHIQGSTARGKVIFQFIPIAPKEQAVWRVQLSVQLSSGSPTADDNIKAFAYLPWRELSTVQ